MLEHQGMFIGVSVLFGFCIVADFSIFILSNKILGICDQRVYYGILGICSRIYYKILGSYLQHLYLI